MNITLWIVAGVLAAAFGAAGLMKATQPKEKLIESGQGWTEDFSPQAVKAIGALEALGALGLILPPLVDIAPVLAPIAAVGLALTMVGAALTHLRRQESQMVVANAILFALAVFVAWGRFGPYSF